MGFFKRVLPYLIWPVLKQEVRHSNNAVPHDMPIKTPVDYFSQGG